MMIGEETLSLAFYLRADVLHGLLEETKVIFRTRNCNYSHYILEPRNYLRLGLILRSKNKHIEETELELI